MKEAESQTARTNVVEATTSPTPTCRTSQPDAQEIALVAYGHRIPAAPPAQGDRSAKCVGIASWDGNSEELSKSFASFLDVKKLHPWTALAVLAATGRLLGAVQSRLVSRYQIHVVHAAAIMLTCDWEFDGDSVSKAERAAFLAKLNLHGMGDQVRSAAAQLVQVLGSSGLRGQ